MLCPAAPPIFFSVLRPAAAAGDMRLLAYKDGRREALKRDDVGKEQGREQKKRKENESMTLNGHGRLELLLSCLQTQKENLHSHENRYAAYDGVPLLFIPGR